MRSTRPWYQRTARGDRNGRGRQHKRPHGDRNGQERQTATVKTATAPQRSGTSGAEEPGILGTLLSQSHAINLMRE